MPIAYFDANTCFMETAQKSDETQVGLLECRVASEEKRLQWDKELQTHKLEGDEVAKKMNLAKEVLNDPNMPDELRQQAQAALAKYLEF